ncbi:hypothetical protein BH23GEM11_BH23GEM11_11740 [soil metagenome]
MSTLVLGGTGTVGSEVVRELLEREAGDLRVLTRDPNRLSDLPRGVEGVAGDLTDPTTLGSPWGTWGSRAWTCATSRRPPPPRS